MDRRKDCELDLDEEESNEEWRGVWVAVGNEATKFNQLIEGDGPSVAGWLKPARKDQ